MLTEYLNGEFDLAHSYVIGDRLTDVQLAKNLGVKAIFLRQWDDPAGHEQEIELIANDWEEIYRHLQLPPRRVSHRRTTRETDISIDLNLDGAGQSAIHTGIGFFDHLLDQLARHGNLDLTITALGDLHIDEHHTIEDTALALGEAFALALKDKRGLERYGFAEYGVGSAECGVGSAECGVADKQPEFSSVLSSRDTPDSALRTPHSGFRTPHSALRTPDSALPTPHSIIPMDDALAQVALDFGGRPWLVWSGEFRREKIGEMPTEMFFHFFKSFSDTARCNLNIRVDGQNEHHKIEAVFKALARAIKMAVRRDPANQQLPTTKGQL